MPWLLLAGLAVVGGFSALLWIGRREHRTRADELARFYALPESEARAWALRMLEQNELFQCKPATCPLPQRVLPQSVRDVLERFEEIERGEFWVGRRALEETPVLAGYIKIGGDFEFEEILVREGSSEIHLSYGPDHGRQPPETMPSLWHKLILASEVPLQ